MDDKTRLLVEQTDKCAAIHTQLETALADYKVLIIDLRTRDKELDAKEEAINNRREKLSKEEVALISGMEALDAAQKKASEDQATLDSQITKYDKLVVNAQSRATEAKHFETDLLEGLVAKGVEDKLNKMMESK